jgi:predicted signal transduction protein with EAL and GGDEF domain
VARLEGDEFALLLDDMRDPRDFVVIADRLRRDLDRSFWVGGQEVFLTASLGLAEGASALRAEDLVRNAESALHLAKGRGRGNLEIFDPAMRAAAAGRLRLEASLRRAVEEGEFVLHFQPLVGVADGRPYGCEALVRWPRLAEHGVLPEEFVALAESSGLIHGMGRWVLGAALEAIARWGREPAAGSLSEVHVNLSRKQLAQPGLVREVADALAASGVAPARLTFEVTETAVMDDPDVAESRLLELRSLGVGLAIDDFGKGYSSLGLLQRFPFDTLKIDRDFARELPESARSLDLRVVVEGIERPEQLAVLRALGCHGAQGFLFSPALPERELLALLASDPRW